MGRAFSPDAYVRLDLGLRPRLVWGGPLAFAWLGLTGEGAGLEKGRAEKQVSRSARNGRTKDGNPEDGDPKSEGEGDPGLRVEKRVRSLRSG